jgi:hypothetical protein
MHQVTDHCGVVVSAPVSRVRVFAFEPRPEDWVSWLRVFILSLTTSRKILWQYVKIGYDRFFLYLFQFIIHITRRYTEYATKRR